MKKNQERRLHRKNAKIVKEGGTPMQLNRPIKPDTTRRCGHCGQMGHMKTNRKCPRWAEFNSGTPPMPTPGGANASSPPPPSAGATSPTASGSSAAFTFGKSQDSLFSPTSSPVASNLLRAPSNLGGPSHGPSPLATSPPVMAMSMDGQDDGDEDDEDAPSSSAPKLKLTLKKS